MYQELFKSPRVVMRHRSGPLAAQRESYLRYRAKQGCAVATLIAKAEQLLRIAQYLRISGDRISSEQIREAANRWAYSRRLRKRGRRSSYTAFVALATEWCRFLGCLQEPIKPTEPFADFVFDFAHELEFEHGLSAVTIRNYCWHAREFLHWYHAERSQSIENVLINDVDAFLAHRGKTGWSRVSVASCANVLRAFFRYLGRRGTCHISIATAIEGPRLFIQGNIPMGPTWEDVGRLLAEMATDSARDVRDKAIIMLCAIYGFRSREVVSLCIEDIDWEHNQISIRRPKQRC